MEEPDDDEIVIRLLDRDELGLHLLLNKHGAATNGALSRAFPWLDESDRHSVLEQGARNAFRSAVTYDDDQAPLKVWFTTIVLNAAKDMFRSGKLGYRIDVKGDLERAADKRRSADDVSDEEVSGKLLGDMKSAINELTPRLKEVALADFHDPNGTANTRELAKKFGIGLVAVRQARVRYRIILKEQLQRKGYTSAIGGRPDEQI